MLQNLISWLANTSLSAVIRSATWVIPVIQTVHILSISALISCAFLIDLRILGVFSQSLPIATVTRRLLPWLWGSLGVVAFSGSLLIAGEPERSLTNVAFGVKMSLLIPAVVIAILRRRGMRWKVICRDRTPSAGMPAKVIAVTSLLLWSSVVFAGRWIAYLGPA
jgi:hypothetical protein